MNNLSKIFNSTSKNLAEDEKFFSFVELNITNANQTVLNNDLFADITFGALNVDCPVDYSIQINQISNKAFGKSAQSLRTFSSLYCGLKHSPPDYDVWKIFSSINKLQTLAVGLDVDQIPSNAIKPIDGSQSKLKSLILSSERFLTVKSNAIENLVNLQSITIGKTKINKFEKESFKLNGKSDKILIIYFHELTLTGDSFENGTFDGINRNKSVIVFQYTKINYLAEQVFKPFLENKKNLVQFSLIFNPEIDCDDCRNYWIIRDHLQEQIYYPFCKQNNKLTLFDLQIQAKFKAKCKSKQNS